jgi:hypothetical protein
MSRLQGSTYYQMTMVPHFKSYLTNDDILILRAYVNGLLSNSVRGHPEASCVIADVMLEVDI